MRIRIVGIVGLVGVVAAAAGLLVRADASDAASRGRTPAATARIERRDLVDEDTFDGVLGYDGATTVTNHLNGTITDLRDEGTVLTRGEWLYEVDEVRVRLLYGAKPMWRALSIGVSDGDDVHQLEKNLVAMGYDPYDAIDVDRDFDHATQNAIERWEEELGVTEDGVLEFGDVVFLPGPVRVGDVQTTIGSSVGPGATIADVSSTSRVVTLDVEVERRSLFRKGRSVDVELPNGTRVKGVVASVGTVAEAAAGDDGGSPTVEVVISLKSGTGVGGLDATPVDVKVASEVEKDVLTVPVAALLALAEGGYAVEVQRGDGTELVGVEIGTYANGYVEISGDGIREGMKVVIPE